MNQIGMTLPGGRAKRGASPNVYTVLAVIATLALGSACGFMVWSGMKISPDGSPISLQQEGRIQFAD